MSEYKLEFELLQQTPLIHFQGDQNGATLRATEVKPKLDRFIIKKLGGNDYEKGKKLLLDVQHNGWIIGYNYDAKAPEKKPAHYALNYKMRIIASGVNAIDIKGNNSTAKDIKKLYYGNLEKATECKNIKLTIICTTEELREQIEKYIKDFFIAENFGTMQDKGFGSFIVKSKNNNISQEHIAKVLKEEYGAKKCYVFPAGTQPFSRIKTIYSIMKSGINHKNYRRSLLFLYMHNKCGINNEKAFLKQEKIAPTVSQKHHTYKEKTNPQKKENSYYVRALLGVGGRLEFINSAENRKDKTKISIECQEKPDDKIERLESFVFFKVIDNNVYYVARRIDERLFGKKFKFTNNNDKKKFTTLTVPTRAVLKENFEDDFLDFCYKCFNPEKRLLKDEDEKKLFQNVDTNILGELGLGKLVIEEV